MGKLLHSSKEKIMVVLTGMVTVEIGKGEYAFRCIAEVELTGQAVCQVLGLALRLHWKIITQIRFLLSWRF